MTSEFRSCTAFFCSALVLSLLLAFAAPANASLAGRVHVALDPNNPDNQNMNDIQWKFALYLDKISLSNGSAAYLKALKVYQNESDGSVTKFVDYNLTFYFLIFGNNTGSCCLYLFECDKQVPEPGIYNVTIMLTWMEGVQTAPAINDTLHFNITDETQYSTMINETYYSTMQVFVPSAQTTSSTTSVLIILILIALYVIALLMVTTFGHKRR